MPGARCTRSLACKSKIAHEVVTTGSPEQPGIPRAMVLTVSFVLFPVTGYPMHTSLLRRSSNTDSLFMDGAEGDRCRRRWGWGDLAIAAWKKGGLVARGTGSATGLMHSTPCGEPGPGGSVHAISAQRKSKCR